MAVAMFDVFNTPLRGAAAGMGVVALGVLAISYSDTVLRRLDRTASREDRNARRLRFRNYALTLLCLSICMVVGSNLIVWMQP